MHLMDDYLFVFNTFLQYLILFVIVIGERQAAGTRKHEGHVVSDFATF
jgi:hypothetical protein